jgi:hypothetical protein
MSDGGHEALAPNLRALPAASVCSRARLSASRAEGLLIAARLAQRHFALVRNQGEPGNFGAAAFHGGFRVNAGELLVG